MVTAPVPPGGERVMLFPARICVTPPLIAVMTPVVGLTEMVVPSGITAPAVDVVASGKSAEASKVLGLVFSCATISGEVAPPNVPALLYWIEPFGPPGFPLPEEVQTLKMVKLGIPGEEICSS